MLLQGVHREGVCTGIENDGGQSVHPLGAVDLWRFATWFQVAMGDVICGIYQ